VYIVSLSQTKLPKKEAELESQIEAVETAQRIIRNTEAQIAQIKAI
jgi:hypothetical protein